MIQSLHKFGLLLFLCLLLKVSTAYRKSRTLVPSSTRLSAIIGPVRYSSNDWLECLQTLPTSRILKRTKYNIFANFCWSSAVTLLYRSRCITQSLPPIAHTILGSALGLLLVFRTNSAYDRFWEGRKSLGKVIIGSRDIARLSGYLPKAYHKRIAELIVMYIVMLKQHLQGEREVKELQPFGSSEDDIASILHKRNRPLYVLQLLERCVNEAIKSVSKDSLPGYIEKGFLDAFENLSTQVGVTERIVKQPVPLSYSRHTSRFLSLYLFTLPFALLPSAGFLTVPIVSAICWAFISILEIGHFIEVSLTCKLVCFTKSYIDTCIPEVPYNTIISSLLLSFPPSLSTPYRTLSTKKRR